MEFIHLRHFMMGQIKYRNNCCIPMNIYVILDYFCQHFDIQKCFYSHLNSGAKVLYWSELNNVKKKTHKVLQKCFVWMFCTCGLQGLYTGLWWDAAAVSSAHISCFLAGLTATAAYSVQLCWHFSDIHQYWLTCLVTKGRTTYVVELGSVFNQHMTWGKFCARELVRMVHLILLSTLLLISECIHLHYTTTSISCFIYRPASTSWVN